MDYFKEKENIERKVNLCKEKLKENIFSLVYEVFKRFQERMDLDVAKTGLTHLQLTILVILKEKKSNTVGNLSKELGINQGNTSSICKKIEKMGYLERKRNEQDERVVNLFLTKEGEKVIDTISSEWKRMIDPILEETSEEALGGFLLKLQKINSNLQKINYNNH